MTIRSRFRHGVRLCALLILGSVAVGCSRDQAPELQTRTFEILHLEDWVAESLVEPYVYASRPGAPGMASVVEGKLTVRETPDNLRRIEETLLEFDRPTPAVRVTFQIIEANGESDVDPRIADVESALRELFRFEGYRLLGEVMVNGTEGNEVFQEFDVPDLGPSAIEATIRDVRTDSSGGSVQLEMRFHAGSRTVFGTTVRVRAGQTAVLGRTPSSVGSRNIILAVKTELLDI
ncbi:MAG: hypothetical protein Q8W45_03055 [Candidatus Palauibacterales bacterium]|nr:hypothetical protein [Candidatus Palauibacterales bacterium]MDP2482237.1 hypothetical protein [Candidatus Palauibacterales bacterium]